MEQTKLLASDGAANDLFGHSVGISGDTIVVGTLFDDTSVADTGSAYVYDLNEPPPPPMRAAPTLATRTLPSPWTGPTPRTPRATP